MLRMTMWNWFPWETSWWIAAVLLLSRRGSWFLAPSELSGAMGPCCDLMFARLANASSFSPQRSCYLQLTASWLWQCHHLLLWPVHSVHGWRNRLAARWKYTQFRNWPTSWPHLGGWVLCISRGFWTNTWWQGMFNKVRILLYSQLPADDQWATHSCQLTEVGDPKLEHKCMTFSAEVGLRDIIKQPWKKHTAALLGKGIV